MNELNQYYQDYQIGNSPFRSQLLHCSWPTGSVLGYVCSYCGIWVPYSGTAVHSCQKLSYSFCPNWTYHPSENSTEKAFKILKILVKEQIIKEPNSFEEFCKLLEIIARVI